MEASILLTKEMIEQHNWQEVIAECQKKECFNYCSAFCAKATHAFESGDQAAQAVFSLLGKATLAALRPDSKNEPYLEDWLTSFTEEQVSLFRDLAPDVKDAEMRARLADIVWERRHDPNMGRLAVDSYLESASDLEDPTRWVEAAERIERATAIARLLGKQSEHFTRSIAHIEEVLARYDGDDPLFFSAELMEILQEHRQGDGLKYAGLAEKAALRAVAEKDWERARRYLRIKAEWHFRASQPEEGRASRLQLAETYVQEAEEIINTPNRAAPYSHACHKIERAMKAYQDIRGPGAKERWAELYRLLLEYEQKVNGEFITVPLPMSKEAETVEAVLTEYAINQVKGKSVVEALVALALLPAVQNVARLREQIKEHVNASPTAILLPSVMFSADGRVVARPSSRPSGREDQVEEEARAQLFSSSNSMRQRGVETFLLPAIEQINAEHHVRVRDLIPIVLDSPFIPVEREFIFAKGLHAGITGDHLVATHLLIPQIESSLRHVLNMHGVATSGFTGQNVQNHYDLNRMLTDPALEAKLHCALGEDLVFELKGLLIHHYGANLRNEIAHGTLSVPDFNSSFYCLQSIYLWWLALRLCLTDVRPSDEAAVEEAATKG